MTPSIALALLALSAPTPKVRPDFPTGTFGCTASAKAQAALRETYPVDAQSSSRINFAIEVRALKVEDLAVPIVEVTGNFVTSGGSVVSLRKRGAATLEKYDPSTGTTVALDLTIGGLIFRQSAKGDVTFLPGLGAWLDCEKL